MKSVEARFGAMEAKISSIDSIVNMLFGAVQKISVKLSQEKGVVEKNAAIALPDLILRDVMAVIISNNRLFHSEFRDQMVSSTYIARQIRTFKHAIFV